MSGVLQQPWPDHSIIDIRLWGTGWPYTKTYLRALLLALRNTAPDLAGFAYTKTVDLVY